ncbi:hypothetical protein DM82_3255 [Burkholderia oklahomensis]|uniref:Uncharacterized protein n=1 Tax=Burkholderia oklahomensis TaxID=342113 RepID=A0AAI8B660_9BURK|nr:hypothetical protein DM82_3255 [Burkholderia oklahomensis]
MVRFVTTLPYPLGLRFGRRPDFGESQRLREDRIDLFGLRMDGGIPALFIRMSMNRSVCPSFLFVVTVHNKQNFRAEVKSQLQ